MKRLQIVLALLLIALLVGLPIGAGGSPARRRPIVIPAGGGFTFSFVGSSDGASDSSPPATVTTSSGTISVQSGDLIIAAVQWEDNPTAEVSSILDNNGNNALTKDSEVHNSGSEMNFHLWWGIANTTNASATFTATVDADVAYKKMVVMVYRKSGGTISKDISGTPAIANDTNTSQTVVTGTFSTTGANNLVCAFAGFYTSGSWSNEQVNGVTADNVRNPSGIAGWCDNNTSALTNATASALYSQTRYWVATAISFKVE